MKHLLSRVTAVLAVAALVTLPACGSSPCTGPSCPSPSPSPTPQPGGVEATATVGGSGGTVEVTSATSSLAGARVEIPAGALSQATTITISSVSAPPAASAQLTASGPFTSFGPDGQQFAVPATVTVPVRSSFSSNLVYEYTGTEFRPAAPLDEEAENPGQTIRGGGIVAATVQLSSRQIMRRPDIESGVAAQAFGLTGRADALVFSQSDLQNCIRCKTRAVPISTIIIHSTNDGGAPLENIIHWIVGSLGDSRMVGSPPHKAEAFFATYYIGKDGRVVQLVQDTVETSHISGHNSRSIGIEMHDGSEGYTTTQVDALRTLTIRLMQQYRVGVADVRQHKEFTSSPDHQDPYRWSDADWSAFKASLAPCSPTVTPTTLNVSASGGPQSVSVAAQTSCSWAATTSSSFIAITPPATGSGNGTVRFSVATNTGSARSGTLLIGGRTVTINQAAATSNCTYTVTPTTLNVLAASGTSTVNIATTASCSWVASTTASFISFPLGSSGSGSGAVTVAVTANTGGARTGTLTVGGQTVTVNQAAAGAANNPAGSWDGRWSVNADATHPLSCPAASGTWAATITATGNSLTIRWTDSYHGSSAFTTTTTLNDHSVAFSVDSGNNQITLSGVFSSAWQTVSGSPQNSGFTGPVCYPGTRWRGTWSGTRR